MSLAVTVLLLATLLVFSPKHLSPQQLFPSHEDPKQTTATAATTATSMDASSSPLRHEVIRKEEEEEEEEAVSVGTEKRAGDAVAAVGSVLNGGDDGGGRKKKGRDNYPTVAVVVRSDVHQQQISNSTGSWTMTADDASTNHTLMEVIQALQSHPLTRLQKSDRRAMSLEDQLLYMHSQPECKHVPIFTSMANVFSDLYWQL